MYADKFSTLEEGIYLLNHSVGRPPISAYQQVQAGFIEPWQTMTNDLWPRWIEQIDEFRKATALLLNASWQDICPQTNLSGALSKLLPALPHAPGRNVIVYNEQDFPSMGFVLNQAQRAGFQLRCIPTDSDPLDLQVWDDRLDSSCACVLVTHVQSNTSVKVDVAGICALARKSGVMPIVDIAQSVGVTEIDLSQWDADFVLGSCVKWLCGGPGAAFLWVNPDIIDQCQPTDVGWFSHADPFEFDIHDFRYAKGVLRFWGGTPSVIPYVVAANSIKLIAQIGVDQVRRHNLALNQRLLDSLPEQVAICPVLPELRGGTAVLNFGQQQSTVEQNLVDAGVHFDSRPTGLRMSPHIYNNNAEIDVVTETILGCLNH